MMLFQKTILLFFEIIIKIMIKFWIIIDSWNSWLSKIKHFRFFVQLLPPFIPNQYHLGEWMFINSLSFFLRVMLSWWWEMIFVHHLVIWATLIFLDSLKSNLNNKKVFNLLPKNSLGDWVVEMWSWLRWVS